jgi:O-phospho-L-seryl-tRNASec:L-selenocysteinyl-tRNA synthase
VIDDVGKNYAGRASGSPVLDLFITLLSLGKKGLQDLLAERKSMFSYLSEQLTPLAAKYGERVLQTPGNPISLALSMNNTAKACKKSPKEIGAILFHRCSSGVRIVDPKDVKEVCGIKFTSYGSHINDFPTPYLNVAAAIGMTKRDVDLFIQRLDSTLHDFHPSSLPQ